MATISHVNHEVHSVFFFFFTKYDVNCFLKIVLLEILGKKKCFANTLLPEKVNNELGKEVLSCPLNRSESH